MSDASYRIAGGCLLGLLAFGLPATLFFASQQTPVLLVLLLAAAAGTIKAPAPLWRHELAHSLKTPGVVAAALFIAYAAASALWSPTPDAALARAPKLLALAALAIAALTLGRLMRYSTTTRLAPAALTGIVVLLLLIGLETTLGLFREIHALAPTPTDRGNVANRAALCLAVLIWPLIALARPTLTTPMVVLLCAVALGVAPFTGSLTAALAVAAAAGVALATRLGSALGAGATAGLVLLFAVVPTLIGFDAAFSDRLMVWGVEHDLFSIAHRAGIWRTAGQLIAQAPWLGWGLDSSRWLLPPDTPLSAVIDIPMVAAHADNVLISLRRAPALPLHPHSGWLQIGLELGLIGALGLATATLAAIRGLRGLSTRAALAAVIVIGSVSVGLWQSWWLCLGATAIFLDATATARSADRRSERAS